MMAAKWYIECNSYQCLYLCVSLGWSFSRPSMFCLVDSRVKRIKSGSELSRPKWHATTIPHTAVAGWRAFRWPLAHTAAQLAYRTGQTRTTSRSLPINFPESFQLQTKWTCSNKIFSQINSQIYMYTYSHLGNNSLLVFPTPFKN